MWYDTFVISFAFYFNRHALFILDLPVVQLELRVEQSVPVFWANVFIAGYYPTAHILLLF